jgi:hypothetical protein
MQFMQAVFLRNNELCLDIGTREKSCEAIKACQDRVNQTEDQNCEQTIFEELFVKNH